MTFKPWVKRCLKYAGKIRRRQMPVLIKIIESWAGLWTDQQQRLAQFKRESLTAKVVPTGHDRGHRIARDLGQQQDACIQRASTSSLSRNSSTAPREPDSALVPRIVAASERSFPILTTLIITVLIAVFAVEVQYGVSFGKDKLSPTIATLVALGGLSGSLVHQSGEW